jgi:hypothetical protein
MAKGDGEKAAQFVCEEFRDDAKTAAQDFLAYTTYGSQIDVEIEFIDLAFEVTDKADDQAMVVLRIYPKIAAVSKM